MILLPKNKVFTQDKNELLCDLWTSMGMNFTEEYGKMKVARRMVITTNDITDLGVSTGFKQIGSKIYTTSGSYVWATANARTETAFAKTANGSDPSDLDSDYSDIEVYDSKLWVTGPSKLYYCTSGTGTWSFYNSGGGTSGLSAVPHKLLNFRYKNRLYVTDSGSVKSLTGTTLTSSGANTFTLTASLVELTLTSLVQTDNLLWILTVNPIGETGYIIPWDGSTENTPALSGVIPLDSRGALAGTTLNGTPYIMTVDGRLQYYNGGTFTDAPNGKLPIKLSRYLKNPLATPNTRWIHPNGITIVDGRINILINNEYYDTGTTIDERVPSGVWEYDPIVGWYPKNPLTLFDIGVGTITDYGQNRISRVGALANLKTDNNSSDTYIGTMLAGAQYYSDATTTAEAIWTDDALDIVKKHGYIVPSKLVSETVKDSFTKLWITMKKLLSANDKIIVKYRSEEAVSTEATVTWTSATTFTTTTSMLLKEGYEVEGIQGKGSGYTAHITRVDVAGSTYTVTLDETLGASSGTAKIRIQNWKKLNSWTEQSTLAEFGAMGTYPWIQLKICFLFTGDDEVYKFIIENKPAVTVAPYSYN